MNALTPALRFAQYWGRRMTRDDSDVLDAVTFRLADSASHLLHRAEQLAADRFSKLVNDELTLRQFTVLAAISETPGLSQSDLVRATGVDRSTLADMVGRMERRGWVVRSASPLDGRAHAVRLAAPGATILSAAIRHARAADAAILDALPRSKGRTFLSVLRKLAKFSDELAAKAERESKRAAKTEARERRKKKSRPANVRKPRE